MKRTVIKINTNITTGEHFNSDGASFRSSEPQVSYRSNFLVEWRLFTETPNADESGVDLSLWTPADFSGCGAIVTCDNDFRHRVTGTLATAINAGETVSSFTVKTSAASVDVPESGMIALYSDSGSVKDIEYAGMTITANGYILQLSEDFTADANYPAGSSANISQEPLFQAMYIPEESDVKGLFVFDCYAYSKRLAALADTSAGRNITVQGLEILPFATDDNGVIRELPAYLIDTFTLNVNLAEVGTVIPEYSGDESELLKALSALVIQGVSVEVYSAATGWVTYEVGGDVDGFSAWRMRLSADGDSSSWSQPIPLIPGPQGKQGNPGKDGTDGNPGKDGTDGNPGADAPQVQIQYSVDGVDWTATESTAEYIRFSTDGGTTWAGAVYTKGLKGDKGDRGAAFTVDATGLLADRSQYDSEAKDFSFLATDNGNMYIKASDTSGDWSDPIPFKGDKGDKPFNLKGQWSAEVSYSVDDAVTNNGSFYIAKSASTGIEPDGTSAYWELYVAKGATGSPGKDGVDGKDGQPLEANYIDISTVTDGFLVISNDTIPVSVEINNAVYPILGMVKEGLNYKIPTANILAAANLESYSGVWRVWRAGGRPGEKGADGTPGGTFSIEVVGVLPTDPDSTTLYLIPLE